MILCVTGPMAAGKNVASDILTKDFAFASVDCDLLVHQAIENSKDKILSTFGSLAKEKGIELLNVDGKINRRAIGKIIFGKSELVAKQESIVFPETERLIEEFIESNKGKDIVINATVLYKIKAINFCSSVIYIDCFAPLRLYRAYKRDKMCVAQILKRFHSQKTLFLEYRKIAADINRVWNFGSRKRLRRKLELVVKSVRQRI